MIQTEIAWTLFGSQIEIGVRGRGVMASLAPPVATPLVLLILFLMSTDFLVTYKANENWEER